MDIALNETDIAVPQDETVEGHARILIGPVGDEEVGDNSLGEKPSGNGDDEGEVEASVRKAGDLADLDEGETSGDEEATAGLGMGRVADMGRPPLTPDQLSPIDVTKQTALDPSTGPANEDMQEGPTSLPTSMEESADPNSSSDLIDNQSPAPINALLRPPTPSSRTSTPPLTAPVRKFSSINVNKKFLSKTVSPVIGLPAIATKIGGFGGRPAASPVPISSTSSRLLSTKLTTVPSSKSSTFPLPQASVGGAGSASASPWAKPTIPLAIDSQTEPQTLHQPAPRQSRTLTSTIPLIMGSGQGIGASSSRPAWRAVPAEGRKPLALSRDFPTTNEIAEGKKSAAMAAQATAQAQAAHNQAIIQGLNAFTQLDPNTYRWDDEDDDDDPIDFGDGTMLQPHETLDPSVVIQSEPLTETPVAKSERFLEDFDRSWPRGRPVPVEPLLTLPKRPDSDRVLFNASLNRLELTSTRPAPIPPQPRLMSRLEPSSTDLPARPVPATSFKHPDKSVSSQLSGAGDGGRMLPPHMTATQPSGELAPLANASMASTSSRQAWSVQRVADRQPPPHIAERSVPSPPNISPGTNPSIVQSFSSVPPRQHPSNPSSQAAPRPLPSLPPIPSGTNAPISLTAALAPSGPPADQQTAEMHTAAEKARLRRLAEEAEREAAAERARRKGKELEERLGLKAPMSENRDEKVNLILAAPPGLTKASTPTITLATRPKPVIDSAQPILNSLTAAATIAGLPPRPSNEPRHVDPSWRGRTQLDEAAPRHMTKSSPAEVEGQTIVPTARHAARPTAQSFFDSDPHAAEPSREVWRNQPPAQEEHFPATPLPPRPSLGSVDVAEPAAIIPADAEQLLLPKKESNFDSMLARIQAAMAQARARPISSSVASAPTPFQEAQAEPPKNITQPDTSPIDPLPGTAARPRSPIVTPPTSVVKPLPEPIQQYFDVSQPIPPRSPPPAWRTFAVKLPKAIGPNVPVPNSRIQAFESSSTHLPRTWLMSFDPPIENLSQLTLSRADLLLPQPLQRRFSKHADTGPLVSISPRRFDVFEKRSKKKVTNEVPRPQEMVVPSAAVEYLLPSIPFISPHTNVPSRQLRNQRSHTGDSSRWKAELATRTIDFADGSSRTSDPASVVLPAVQTEKNGMHPADPLGFRLADRGRLPLDMKPGVRFLVSEGDSLLAEVNKMSLEAVGGGDDKGDDVAPDTESKTPGSATPRTPPSLSATSSRGNPSSPNGTSTPWTKSSARSSSQHDHLKSVWDQTPETASEITRPIEPFAVQKPLITSINPAQDAPIPMYPSLNAPSSADPPAAQPLPNSTKMGYPKSQTFSSPGGVPPSTSFRQSPSHAYGYSSPEAGQSTMGLSYASLGGARPNGSNLNGFAGAQQGVWSASAFGPGYGYGAKPSQGISTLDQKAAMAFNTASPAKEESQIYSAPYTSQSQSSQGHPAESAPQGYGGTGQPYGHAGQGQLATSYDRNVTGPSVNGAYYPYGAVPARGHPSQQNRDFPAARYGESGGYYGGVGTQQGQLHGAYQNYGGHGAVGQQGRPGAGMIGQGQGVKKLW